jgi:UDP-N-acetylmuramate--alanine ligase
MELAPRIVRRKVTYSLGGRGDVQGKVVERGAGWTRFSVSDARGALGEVTLHIPGDHYVRNALAAVAVGLWLDIPFDLVRAGLEGWQGVGRRFEMKGEAGGVIVIDDYGHHPTEVAATIQAALSSYKRRLFVLFQPHRYSRTQALAAEFGKCFDGAHRVFVTDIYAAGEKPIPGVETPLIVERVQSEGRTTVEHVPTYQDGVRRIAEEARAGDMVITMGAGDVTKAGDLLLSQLGAAFERKG